MGVDMEDESFLIPEEVLCPLCKGTGEVLDEENK